MNVHVDAELSKNLLDALAVVKREREEIWARLTAFEARFGALEEKVATALARSATEAIKTTFSALVTEWRATRGHHSRVDKLVLNRAY